MPRYPVTSKTHPERLTKEIELTVQQYAVSSAIPAGLLKGGAASVRAELEFHVERLAHILNITARVPADVLQDRKLIAEYPANLWQYIRKALGLHYRKTEVRLNEHLVFPTIAIPPHLGKQALLYVEPQVRSYTTEGNW